MGLAWIHLYCKCAKSGRITFDLIQELSGREPILLLALVFYHQYITILQDGLFYHIVLCECFNLHITYQAHFSRGINGAPLS